jgi:extracellular matrix protein 14
MAPLGRALVAGLALCGTAIAVPSDPQDLFHTLPHQAAQVAHRPSGLSQPWTRLRDAIIHKIWGPAPPCGSRSPYRRPHSATLSAPSTLRARYGGDVVLRFKLKTAEEARALARAADTLYLDVWESAHDWVDVRMAKDVVEPLLGLLPRSLHNAHSPLMHDLAQTIFESYPAGSIAQKPSMSYNVHQGFTPSLDRGTSDAKELFFKDYQPLSVIVPWMRLMESLFPSHVQLINIGLSYEGRDIPALRIGARQANDTEPGNPRHTILISAGSHAREWISTAATSYVAYSLITRYGRFPAVTKLIDEFDWVFIPTLNPDGYVYTWDHDRLWRKNRQQTNIRFCPGVDLDRTFGFQWDGDATRSNPCSESYAGDGPFEGMEAHRLALWAQNETQHNNVEFAAFIDLHSYSQEILYPYSFSCDELPPTLENLEELAIGLAKAIRLTHNQWYGVTSACEGSTVASRQSAKDMWPRMELNGGSALDWFYHELKVKYAYQIKLRDTGSYGFLLPSNHILPTGQEMFNAALDLGQFLLSNKGIEMAHLDWKAEYISPASPVRASENQQETGRPEQSEDTVDEGYEGDDFSTELRRKRRRK